MIHTAEILQKELVVLRRTVRNIVRGHLPMIGDLLIVRQLVLSLFMLQIELRGARGTGRESAISLILLLSPFILPMLRHLALILILLRG